MSKRKSLDVDSIAQGRVWTGADAKRLGLGDMFGGLETAIGVAAKRAGLQTYRLQSLPEQKDAFEKVMERFNGDSEARILKAALGDTYKYYEQMNHLMNMRSYQARMPYQIEVY